MADAEQLTLNAIKRFGQPNWDVIHSLWIKRHFYKEHAEVDFVLITLYQLMRVQMIDGLIVIFEQ